jgi:hypothetical protein
LRGLHWLIETVNGQLAECFRAKQTWAKDLWHLCSRVPRRKHEGLPVKMAQHLHPKMMLMENRRSHERGSQLNPARGRR